MPAAPSLLVDANLLTLLVVGSLSEEEIRRCKRTRKYDVDDFRHVLSYVGRFPEIVVTPHILTECSNLVGALHGKHLARARATIAELATLWTETYRTSQDVVQEDEFVRLGLADAAVLLAGTDMNLEVLTDDLDLYLALSRRGVPVMNYTHWRTANWLQH